MHFLWSGIISSNIHPILYLWVYRLPPHIHHTPQFHFKLWFFISIVHNLCACVTTCICKSSLSLSVCPSCTCMFITNSKVSNVCVFRTESFQVWLRSRTFLVFERGSVNYIHDVQYNGCNFLHRQCQFKTYEINCSAEIPMDLKASWKI